MGIRIGMLWYDDTLARSLEEKISRAIVRYRLKYGVAPTLCYVNPATEGLGDGEKIIEGVTLHPARTVMVNHFWIGDEARADGQKNPVMAAAPRRR